MPKIIIDPVTRIEGHLKVECNVEGGKVREAKSSGTLFRGIEIILSGRDPRDATQITQRICGVCPVIHAYTSSLCLDNAFGVDDKITDNGRIIRNLILTSNYLQSHILHFYHLTALDYVDVTNTGKIDDVQMSSVREFLERGELSPFVPRYEGDYRLSAEENKILLSHYIQAFEIRRKCHEMLTIFGGKMPHQVSIVAGGVTCSVTSDKIARFLAYLNEISEFINNIYIQDVLTVAKKYSDYWEIGKGCKNLLSFGVLELDGKEKDLFKRNRFFKSGRISSDLKLDPVDAEKIQEWVKYSWYKDNSAGKHPLQGETVPEPNKKDAYSFLKAPRYDKKVYEVGPVARILINYLQGHTEIKEEADKVLKEAKIKPDALFSVLGRHACRAIEAKVISRAMQNWLLELKPGEPVYTDSPVPEESQGIGFAEGPRGAIIHAVRIKNKKIENYQVITPTSWNGSPKDDSGQPGPIEQAIVDTKIKNTESPIEIVRIIRSFDPCLACAVHLIKPSGRKINLNV